MDAPGELTQLVKGRLQLRARLVQELAPTSDRSDLHARQPELDRERHEPRLGAVVQVALEPPALGVAGLDETRARGAQLLDPRAQLGGQPLVLERQRRSRARRARRAAARRPARGRGRSRRSAGRGARPPSTPPPAVYRPPDCVDEAPRPGSQYASSSDGSPSASASAARSASLRRLAEARDEPGHRGGLDEPAAQQPGEERERDRRDQHARAARGRPAAIPAASKPLTTTKAANAAAARPQHRCQRAALRGAARSPAPDDDRPSSRRSAQTADRGLHRVQRVRQRLVASTISRLRGSPGSSNSSDGTWSTVTAK